MDLPRLIDVLHTIQGCTFASVDTRTKPQPGVVKTATLNVILFTNRTGSGYERMVRRRMAEQGLDPASFCLSDLPWGSRIPETPLIEHKRRYYLQTVVIQCNKENYTLFGKPMSREALKIKEDKSLVPVRTIDLDHIESIRLIGESL